MSEDKECYVARVIEYEGTTLVNICDEELVGTTVTDGRLKMHISQEYFGRERIGIDEALHLVRSSSVSNLAGERIVRKVVEAKLASELAIKKVGSASFLMIFKFAR